LPGRRAGALDAAVKHGEVFWWVEPEHRGEGVKLLREAEKRAKHAGAQTMQMIAPTDKVAGLYQRFGYEFVEAAYQKSL
jgi:GNAT superfamily N-acetyltransferase